MENVQELTKKERINLLTQWIVISTYKLLTLTAFDERNKAATDIFMQLAKIEKINNSNED